MNQTKLRKLLAAFCTLGTAMTAVLEFYMLHLAGKYPEIETFSCNARIVGVLLIVWLAVTAYFFVQAYRKNKDR